MSQTTDHHPGLRNVGQHIRSGLLFSRSVDLAQRRKGPAYTITQAGLAHWRPSSGGQTERGNSLRLGSIWLNRPRPVEIVAYAAFGACLGWVAGLFEALVPASALPALTKKPCRWHCER
jgi:hypothetical protein